MTKCRLSLRGGALTLAVMAAMAPFASAAGAGGEQDVPVVAPLAAHLAATADRPSRRLHDHARAPIGTDEQHDAGDAVETRAERDLVLASTWHLDPELLVPQATDSARTVAAREELARVNARLPGVVAAYDEARAGAAGAAIRAEVATSQLRKASAVAARARARWESDRALLVSYVTEAYTTDSTGPLGVLVSVGSEQDLLTAMMMLQEVSDTQSTAVEDAARSRDRLQAAAAHLAVVRARAQDRVAAAEAALATATAARERVLGKLRTARTVLEDSVLADQLAAIKARKLARAAASAVAPVGVVDGPPGHVSFPLPADASFVDQDNWGASSAHWAQVHTGDDLSTACGTPVLAATDGTVLVRTDQTWSGRWLVLVSTGEGRLTTWYAHMQELLVTDGASVRAGQQIGVVGEEGNATGCHLHFEVHPSGGSIYEDDTDPRGWLRAVGVYPG
jgi:murein DD-endopeptidase MepM/ murein hydrolase activator NlpD